MKVKCLQGEVQMDLVWPDESYKIVVLIPDSEYDNIEPEANVIIKNRTARAILEISDDEV